MGVGAIRIRLSAENGAPVSGAIAYAEPARRLIARKLPPNRQSQQPRVPDAGPEFRLALDTFRPAAVAMLTCLGVAVSEVRAGEWPFGGCAASGPYAFVRAGRALCALRRPTRTTPIQSVCSSPVSLISSAGLGGGGKPLTLYAASPTMSLGRVDGFAQVERGGIPKSVNL